MDLMMDKCPQSRTPGGPVSLCVTFFEFFPAEGVFFSVQVYRRDAGLGGRLEGKWLKWGGLKIPKWCEAPMACGHNGG